MKKEKLGKAVVYLLISSLIVIDIIKLLFCKGTIFRGISFSVKVILLVVLIVYFDN